MKSLSKSLIQRFLRMSGVADLIILKALDSMSISKLEFLNSSGIKTRLMSHWGRTSTSFLTPEQRMLLPITLLDLILMLHLREALKILIITSSSKSSVSKSPRETLAQDWD